MKKIILLHTLLLLAIGLHAQYIAFPKDKAVWRADETRGGLLRSSDYPNLNALYDFRFFYQTKDTLIDNLLYKKISEKILISPTTFDSAYYGALREDIPAKKVYFKGKDWKQEKLLFNFELKVGDTIKGWYSLDSLPDSTYFVVKNIKKVKYNTFSLIERNLYELEAFKLPTWAFTFPRICTLYEGIGFSTGLFKSPMWNTKYKRQFRQSCFYDGIVELSDCERITSIEEENSQHSSLTIYPNPTNELLNIQAPKPISKLVVYQSNGTKVLESKSTENLDVSVLPEGLYMLEAIDMEGRRVLKKFEKR